MRGVFSACGFAAVVNRGAIEAGAVFILARGRMGETALYGPAPQTSYDSAKPEDRFFSLLATGDDAAVLDARLEREKKFDPDIWVVEIEAGSVPVEELISVKTP
ncbi:DUF1491 family protein [Mesorhizobium sp. M2D.F.Ca.ET.145.01.1.1]|nr:DUF1491 family protein [Mesorhizobium sp. M2D.F.Ca.ET.145.01.1.1]